LFPKALIFNIKNGCSPLFGTLDADRPMHLVTIKDEPAEAGEAEDDQEGQREQGGQRSL
jgi:hypothetical protein